MLVVFVLFLFGLSAGEMLVGISLSFSGMFIQLLLNAILVLTDPLFH